MWHLKGSPLSVQVEAEKRLTAAPGNRYGLWMDMGTGKTATAYNHLSHLFFMGTVGTALVICPNSLKGNWKEEAEKWNFRHPVHDWKEWKVLFDKKESACRVYVMNYEATLTNGGSKFFVQLARRNFHLILDESQAIKNFQSKTSKVIRGLIKEETTKGVTLLSGTPMTQNPMDLYPQLRALGQMDGVNPYAFRARYCKMGGFKGKQVTGINDSTKDELIGVMKRVSWRASKKDWLDLPEKSFVTRDIELTSDQKKLYKEMLEDFLVVIRSQEVPANMVISQLLKLQQISRGFVYSEGNETIEITDVDHDPSLNELVDVVDQNDKTVVMAHFSASIKRLIAKMDSKKIPYACLRGGMTRDEIDQTKKEFNDGPARVMIGQLSAASKGHTLIGSTSNPCYTLVFFENNYNLADRMQAEDRIHRQGQKNACLYVDLASSAIDRKIMKALQDKKFSVQEIIEAMRGPK